MGHDIKILPLQSREKSKYSTSKQERVSEMIEEYKKLLERKSQGYFHVVKGIYDSNVKAAVKGTLPPQHTNLMSLICSVPVLIISYHKIRKNRGATTLGAMLAFHKLRRLNPSQRRFISSTYRSPDGIKLSTFQNTALLLKQGEYPWGASRRIYMEKPGRPDSLRPITIPPFMDRVVQTAILTVLESIYEPWFEIQNRSFGFRQKKGVHDAIYGLTRLENKNLNMAIEGDIVGAYNNVNKAILLEILGKRITDRKFLQLIKERLDYCFLNTLTNKYVEEKDGIPQGGIDSPYLWNIYMSEFDNHIRDYLNNLLSKLNEKVRGNRDNRSKKQNKEQASLLYKRRELRNEINLMYKVPTKEKYAKIIKNKEKDWGKVSRKLAKFFGGTKPKFSLIPKEARYELIKKRKRLRHTLLGIPTTDRNKSVLRFIYIRYADDWIILGNFPKLLAQKIKNHIKEWLKNNLKAELSEQKTTIKNIKKEPALFCGFELKIISKHKLSYKKNPNTLTPVLTRVAGTEIKALPDRQRLIDRLHMKGYCTAKGKPKPMSWISTLETSAIISRFNAVLIGLANFYYGFVRKSALNRWIFIIRTCLLKTLAQKYNTNIKGVYTRFGIRTASGNTISYIVTQKFDENGEEQVMEKTWTLYTELDIQKKANNNKRYDIVKSNFNRIEYEKLIPLYKRTERFPSIKDEDYLNRLMWVNLRTQANFDFPCSRCGSLKNVQMHHIKSVRKLIYSKIPDKNPWTNIMYLRNSRQIPVCAECHMNVIHKGTYLGKNLKSLLPIGMDTKKGYDNRLITIGNSIKQSKKEYYGKSLQEKGWKVV